MKQVTCLTTPTLLAKAGNRDFFGVYNNSDNTIFLSYDSDDLTAVAGGTNPLTVKNGGRQIFML